jgi:hypothetical protein
MGWLVIRHVIDNKYFVCLICDGHVIMPYYGILAVKMCQKLLCFSVLFCDQETLDILKGTFQNVEFSNAVLARQIPVQFL